MPESITVSRKELADAVTFASLALSKRPSPPVMGAMYVILSPGKVTLGAFDYATCAETSIPGHSSGFSSTLIDGRDLISAVRALPKTKGLTVTLSPAPGNLTIECDGATITLPGMDATEYPLRPALPEVSGTLNATAFARSASRVTLAAGTDDTLPALTCVQLAGEHGKLRLAATDRYRLAVDQLDWTGPDGAEVLIPAKILASFGKAIDASGKVTVHLSDKHAGLSDGTRTLIMMTSGKWSFPNVGNLIRTAHDTVVLADARAVAGAVTWAGKLAAKNTPVSFDATTEQLTITSRDGTTERGHRSVPCAAETNVSALFNPAYLASMLSGFSGTVRIGFKINKRTGLNGQIIRTQAPAQLSADDDKFLALVMPVRPADS